VDGLADATRGICRLEQELRRRVAELSEKLGELGESHAELLQEHEQTKRELGENMSLKFSNARKNYEELQQTVARSLSEMKVVSPTTSTTRDRNSTGGPASPFSSGRTVALQQSPAADGVGYSDSNANADGDQAHSSTTAAGTIVGADPNCSSADYSFRERLDSLEAQQAHVKDFLEEQGDCMGAFARQIEKHSADYKRDITSVNFLIFFGFSFFVCFQYHWIYVRYFALNINIWAWCTSYINHTQTDKKITKLRLDFEEHKLVVSPSDPASSSSSSPSSASLSHKQLFAALMGVIELESLRLAVDTRKAKVQEEESTVKRLKPAEKRPAWKRLHIFDDGCRGGEDQRVRDSVVVEPDGGGGGGELPTTTSSTSANATVGVESRSSRSVPAQTSEKHALISSSSPSPSSSSSISTGRPSNGNITTSQMMTEQPAIAIRPANPFLCGGGRVQNSGGSVGGVRDVAAAETALNLADKTDSTATTPRIIARTTGTPIKLQPSASVGSVCVNGPPVKHVSSIMEGRKEETPPGDPPTVVFPEKLTPNTRKRGHDLTIETVTPRSKFKSSSGKSPPPGLPADPKPSADESPIFRAKKS